MAAKNAHNVHWDIKISFSCRLVAMLRAQETKRPDALFQDPYAELLAGGLQIHSNYLYRKYGRLRADGKLKGEEWREKAAEAAKEDMRKRERRPFIAVRTRWMDEIVQRESEHGLPQLVILGSGLDTRSHRLKCLANTTVFELDRPHVLSYKEDKLHHVKPLCERLVYIPAELSDGLGKITKAKGQWSPSSVPWVKALLDGGFDPTMRSVWLCEGLLMYFGKNQVGMILRLITSQSTLGSVVCADVPSKAAVRSLVSYYRLFRWGCDKEAIEGFWAQNGRWVVDIVPFGRKGLHYNRCLEDDEIDDVTYPTKPPRVIKQHFVCARQTKPRSVQ